MKKKIGLIFLMGTMSLSLTACASKKPDLKEVESAISNGEVTIEDALEKGWVTQDWVDEFLDTHSHAAADKTESFAIEDFETRTVSGEKFCNDNIADTTFWAFLDFTTEEAEEWIEILKNTQLMQNNA